MISSDERDYLLEGHPGSEKLVRRIAGSNEIINGFVRYCLWIDNEDTQVAEQIPFIANRLESIRDYRANGSERWKLGLATPHRFERTITGNKC